MTTPLFFVSHTAALFRVRRFSSACWARFPPSEICFLRAFSRETSCPPFRLAGSCGSFPLHVRFFQAPAHIRANNETIWYKISVCSAFFPLNQNGGMRSGGLIGHITASNLLAALDVVDRSEGFLQGSAPA